MRPIRLEYSIRKRIGRPIRFVIRFERKKRFAGPYLSVLYKFLVQVFFDSWACVAGIRQVHTVVISLLITNESRAVHAVHRETARCFASIGRFISDSWCRCVSSLYSNRVRWVNNGSSVDDNVTFSALLMCRWLLRRVHESFRSFLIADRPGGLTQAAPHASLWSRRLM